MCRRLLRHRWCYRCGQRGHSYRRFPLSTYDAAPTPLLASLHRVESGYIRSGDMMMCCHCTQIGHGRVDFPMLADGWSEIQDSQQRGSPTCNSYRREGVGQYAGVGDSDRGDGSDTREHARTCSYNSHYTLLFEWHIMDLVLERCDGRSRTIRISVEYLVIRC